MDRDELIERIRELRDEWQRWYDENQPRDATLQSDDFNTLAKMLKSDPGRLEKRMEHTDRFRSAMKQIPGLTDSELGQRIREMLMHFELVADPDYRQDARLKEMGMLFWIGLGSRVVTQILC